MAKLVTESEAVMRLKARLRYAACILITNKRCDIHHISVSDLADVAKISRATFYNYYDSIDDFAIEVVDFLIDEIVKQEIKLISDGRARAKDNCKTDNLVIPPGDRQLISAFGSFVTFELVEYCVPILHKKFSEHTNELSFSEEFIEDNKKSLGFFVFGFSKTIFRSLVENSDGKKLYKAVSYSFDLWDDLFPENKL